MCLLSITGTTGMGCGTATAGAAGSADRGESVQKAERAVYGSDSEKIGTVDRVYLDAGTGQAAWIAVNTDVLATKTSFVPIAGAQPDREDVRVAYTKDEVNDAPAVEPDEELNQAEEQELWSHYGIEDGEGDA